jgi:hypothetical protein
MREGNRRAGAARQGDLLAGALRAALTGWRAGLVTAMSVIGEGGYVWLMTKVVGLMLEVDLSLRWCRMQSGRPEPAGRKS